MKEQELYQAALKKWGEQSQADMVIEECNELIHVVLKERRGKDSWQHVVEEAVDVSLCTEQIRTQHPAEFAKIKQWKLERLAGLLCEVYEP